jgi:hypothetical protein
VECDVAIDAIGDVLENPGAFVWEGLLEAGEERLRDVQRRFGLHDPPSRMPAISWGIACFFAARLV